MSGPAAHGTGPAPTRIASANQLSAITRRLGAELSEAYPEGLSLIGVLKGGVVFLADVARHVTVPVTFDFLAIAPYDGASARTRLVKDLDADIGDRAAVLVTGIVDTGFTASYLLDQLRRHGPRSVALCGLADKRARRIVPVNVDFVGLEVPDQFLIGYGLDFAGRYRNVPELFGTDSALLAEDPDRFLTVLYGPANRLPRPDVV